MSDDTIIIGKWDETSSNQLTKEITSSGAAMEDRCWKLNKTASTPPTHTHYTQGVGGGVAEADESGPSVPVSNMFSRHIIKE